MRWMWLSLWSVVSTVLLFVIALDDSGTFGWLSPVFLLPFLGAVVLSGNVHAPDGWAMLLALFLQNTCVVLVVGACWGWWQRRAATRQA